MSKTEEDRVLEYFENNKGKVRSAYSIAYHTGIPEKRLVEILEKLTKEGNLSVRPGSTANGGARRVPAWTLKSAGRSKVTTKETGKKPTKELKRMLERQKGKHLKWGEGQQRARKALADGEVKTLEEIAVATGLPRGSLHYVLAGLIRKGEARRVSYGKYQKVAVKVPVEKPAPIEEEPPAPEEPKAEEEPPEEEAVDTRTIKERVLDLMEDGKVRTPTQISKETDTGYSRVGRRLTDLVRSEKLSKVGHAQYKKYEEPPPVPAVSLSLNLNLNINAEYKSLEAFERGMNCLAMGARYLREAETP